MDKGMHTETSNVVHLATERELRHGFKDNHDRAWVRCLPGDTGGKFWNMADGRRVLCRLKYPEEQNSFAINL